MDGSELKTLREKAGLTQMELAELVGVTRKTINTHENSTSIPTSKAQLYKLKMSNKVTVEEKKLPDAVPLINTDMHLMYVPLVSKYAYAGYLGGFGDDEYIEELPKIPFIKDFRPKGNYMCFEVRGDSMTTEGRDSIEEGDILLAREVKQEYWKSKLHIKQWDFVIIHKEEGILVKRIIDHDVDNGTITLHSLNEYYEDLKVHLNDVSQILNIVEINKKPRR